MSMGGHLVIQYVDVGVAWMLFVKLLFVLASQKVCLGEVKIVPAKCTHYQSLKMHWVIDENRVTIILHASCGSTGLSRRRMNWNTDRLGTVDIDLTVNFLTLDYYVLHIMPTPTLSEIDKRINRAHTECRLSYQERWEHSLEYPLLKRDPTGVIPRLASVAL